VTRRDIVKASTAGTTTAVATSEDFSLPYPEHYAGDPTYDRERQIIDMPRNRGKMAMHIRAVLLAFNSSNAYFSGVQNVRLLRHRKSKPEHDVSTTPLAHEAIPQTAATSPDDDGAVDAEQARDCHISTSSTPHIGSAQYCVLQQWFRK
jgi:hypothetical protein